MTPMHAAVAQSLLVRRRSSLVPWVVFSVGAHVALVGIWIVLGVLHLLGGRAPIDLEQKPIKATLVRLGKERDQKLLPRKDEPPPPPQEVKATTPPPPTPAEPPKPVETVPVPGLKPPPPAQTKQAGEKTEQPKKSLASAFSKFAAKAPDQELEGASDGDPLGDSATQEGERYYGALTAQIRRYYDVSSTISEQERMHLRAEVAIRIGPRGELLDARVAKTSGNDLFDSAVVAAAKKASPFAPPPDHLRQELSGRGIILEFTP